MQCLLDVPWLLDSSSRYKQQFDTMTGGAWTIGYKAWGSLLGRRLSKHGCLVCCLDYRNFPQVQSLLIAACFHRCHLGQVQCQCEYQACTCSVCKTAIKGLHMSTSTHTQSCKHTADASYAAQGMARLTYHLYLLTCQGCLY